MADSQESIGWGGFGLRLAFALVLVYATYNPWGVSYAHWILGQWGSDAPASWLASPALKFVIGIALAIAWVVFATSTRRSLGGAGITLIIALCAGVIWFLVEQGIADTSSIPELTHIALIVVALVMAIGMSWSHVRRRLTGQVDTDEVDAN
jgi:FtsH-binding integral membrane protein